MLVSIYNMRELKLAQITDWTNRKGSVPCEMKITHAFKQMEIFFLGVGGKDSTVSQWARDTIIAKRTFDFLVLTLTYNIHATVHVFLNPFTRLVGGKDVPLIIDSIFWASSRWAIKNIVVSLGKGREKGQGFVALAAGHRWMTRKHFCLSTLKNLNNTNLKLWT